MPYLQAVGAMVSSVRRMGRRIGPLGALLCAAGCSLPPAPAASPYELQMRAAFDLGCPVGWVKSYRLDARTTGVEGCGRRLTYVESCEVLRGKERCTWLADAASVLERRAGCGDRAAAAVGPAMPDTRDGRPPGAPAPASSAAAPGGDPFADRR